MQEIEIKFKVDNLDKIMEIFTINNIKLSEKLSQKDTIFVPDINDVANGEGKIFTRVRLENDRVQLTLKKQSSRVMQSKEIEFEVSSFDSAYDFLETLGLKEWVTVEKTRITAKYKGYNICMDRVKRLGDFVEIEIVTKEENNTDFLEQQILSIAKELKIDTNRRINSYYDTMIDELNKSEVIGIV